MYRLCRHVRRRVTRFLIIPSRDTLEIDLFALFLHRVGRIDILLLIGGFS